MSQRRQLEEHLHALGEISQILASMKTLALLETRKLTRYLGTQSRVVEGIYAAAQDFRNFFPWEPNVAEASRHVYLLIGSERGYCGDFNQALIAELQTHREGNIQGPLVIAVGHKLCARLEPEPGIAALLDGPVIAEEVEDVLGELASTLSQLQRQHGPFALSVLHHQLASPPIRVSRVLPPFRDRQPQRRTFADPPLLNLPPKTFFAELLDHYLYATLHEIFYQSLMAENHRRVEHLEAAIHRITEQSAELSLKRNMLRQEEITEEIEVILLSVEAMQDSLPRAR